MEVNVGEAIEVLTRTPGTLRGLLEGLSEPWLSADEGPETFDAGDVLGHLITGEETDWIPRVLMILEHGEARPFVPFDRFAFRRRYGSMSISERLARFEALRRENLERLRGLGLTPAQLALRGTHPELGPVTLGQLLATWVAHDLDHVSQVVRVMARRYQDAVGPWKAYLRIVRES